MRLCCHIHAASPHHGMRSVVSVTAPIPTTARRQDGPAVRSADVALARPADLISLGDQPGSVPGAIAGAAPAASSYDEMLRAPDVDGVVRDLMRWLTAVNRALLLQDPGDDRVLPPDSFELWFADTSSRSLGDQPIMQRLDETHRLLTRMAARLVLRAEQGVPPHALDYDRFTERFDQLIGDLHRIARALAAADSRIDPLTGLRSRAGMREDLQRAQDLLNRGGPGFCLAIGDIDHFKAVNDRYGHDVGDLALAHVSDIINSSIRSFDDAYRHGGEEFLLCLKAADLEKGRQAIERLRLTIETSPLACDATAALALTMSFGLVQAHPGGSLDQLMKEADLALYSAKRGGRNRVVTG